MSDYTLQATWSTKDALATGSALKAISATELGTEFSAIETAIATKYDSNDIASQAQAEAETLNTVLITPARLANWADYNAGVVGDLQAYVDPNADTLFGWDDSAGAAIGFTAGAGIVFSGTTLTADHDAATNFVADEHIAHSGVTLTAGNGLTGGGTIAASRSFAVGAGSGITVNANDVALTDAAASTTNPISVASGVIDIDISALTSVEADALAVADEFIVWDNSAGAPVAVTYSHLGMLVQTAQTSQTLAAADANTIMEFDTTATITVPADATHTFPPGSGVLICNDNAATLVTVTVSSTAILNSVHHPGGATTVSDTVDPGGTALLLYLGSDEWYLSGNVTD